MEKAWIVSYDKVQQLVQLSRYKEALKEAQKLLQHSPEEPDAYSNIGWIHYLMKAYDQALYWSGEALARDPENVLAWYVRVVVYYDTDQEAAFEKSLTEALRIEPYKDYYYFLNASRFLKKGSFKAAREQIVRALELAPESPHNLALHSYTEALLVNDSESRRAEREALRRNAEDPTVFTYLSWAANKRGEYDLAEKYMANAVRLNPENKQIRDEYLEALQNGNKVYRIFLWPTQILRRLKPWQIFLAWVVAWIIFKPLIILFIILYILAHWISKGIVHVRVFGWRLK